MSHGMGLGSVRLTVVLLAAAGAACAGGPPPPAELDTTHESCAHCRMMVSDAHFAAQIVAPGEVARFFDDVGCLAAFLREAGGVAPGALAYVADHRTAAWVVAAGAVYTRVDGLSTPMNSGIIAHADAASREADPAAAGGTPVTQADLFGPSGPPHGAR